MTYDNIKSCPHCGGPATLNANYSYKSRSYFVFCKCTLCGATGKTYSSAEDPAATDWQAQACADAVAAWNMRTTEPRGMVDYLP